MNTERLIKKLYKKVVPVVAINSIEQAKTVAEFLLQKGYDCIEVTYRTKAASEAIKYIKGNYNMLVGAGTVLDKDTAKNAINSGADFIVSPGFYERTVEYCIEQNIPIIPGVETASEINRAVAYGVTFVKFFPAEATGGITKLKALHAPFPNVKFMPTGGIDVENVKDYLALEYVVCCGGSYIVPKDL